VKSKIGYIIYNEKEAKEVLKLFKGRTWWPLYNLKVGNPEGDKLKINGMKRFGFPIIIHPTKTTGVGYWDLNTDKKTLHTIKDCIKGWNLDKVVDYRQMKCKKLRKLVKRHVQNT